MRVLQSFPHRIGASRICTTAWHQAAGAAEAGANVLVMTGSVHKPLPPEVTVRQTLAVGSLRVPFRAVGRARALAMHDRIVARSLPRLASSIDVVHAWPQGALETLETARRLGIPTVLERANAHTRFAYDVVRQECERLGVALPDGHEHAYDEAVLAREEAEFALADRLLCPSDFVLKTFLDKGFAPSRLVRHQYGFDPSAFSPEPGERDPARPFTALFVGGAAVRKGTHFALEAWLRSPASRAGRLRIAGAFVPEYEAKLAPLLAHPSVEALGHRTDVAELMRSSDVLVLPSLEEGSALVTSEAAGSGCVPVVSDASGALCVDGVSGLVHPAGDVEALTRHLTMLFEDPALLARLRRGAIDAAPAMTWSAAGRRLAAVYAEVAGEPAALRAA